MQWSQLKHRIEEGFAPALSGRLELHYTVYRNLTEGDGRAWLTWDGEQFHSRADMPSHEELDAQGGLPMGQARDLLGDLHDYLRTPFDQLLNSADPLIRSLALADRRLGRRRFEKYPSTALSDPLVARLYHLRGEAEGWLAT